MQPDPLIMAQQEMLSRYRNNAREFIEKRVRIEDRDAPNPVIPFPLWPEQEKVLQLFLDKDKRLSIVLKARQLGLTWLALSYAAWKMVFTPGYAVVALSKREDDAKELVRRMAFIMRHLPKWITRKRTKEEKDLQLPTWDNTTLDLTIFHPEGEPSTFKSMSAAPDSGRSFTASLVILDEWAFQEYARDIWSAAYPMVNRPDGGQVIGLSTAKRGTLFENIWDGAREGSNGFTPIFLPWNADPRRTQEWYEQAKADMLVENNPDQNFHTEYPETAEEAFMFAGNNVFDGEKVNQRIRTLKAQYRENPPKKGDIESGYNLDTGDPVKGTARFVEDVNGQLMVYRMPEEGIPYVIGADVAEGVGGDYSVANVIDNTSGRQVAVWRGHIDADNFGKILFSLGYFYNEALINVEANSVGMVPIVTLERLRYPKQYERVLIDNITKQRQQRHGYRTTTSTRDVLISGIIAAARDDIEVFVDLATLGEMLTFVRNTSGKQEALQGKHDDCILAAALTYAARPQQRYEKTVPKQSPVIPGGTYAYGELKLMGLSDAQIRKLRGTIHIIGDRAGGKEKKRLKY